VIRREILEHFFAAGPSRGIDFERDLLWGYFFTHEDPALLERARPVLEKLGYRFVAITNREGRGDTKFLHVERVETHTVATLFARYKELSSLALKHHLDSFDGFDVGNVDGSAFNARS
jgi:hypothetical protein